MFERFYTDELKRLLRECLRVFKDGGGVRLIVLGLESAIAPCWCDAASGFWIPSQVSDLPHSLYLETFK
jgi:predicted SAM-dependent methyltransferase